MEQKRVSVFAGNRCAPNKEKYYFDLAYQTGKLLAQKGLIVVSGAGPGLMDQVLKGAFEAGGRTFGVALNVAGRHQSQYVSEMTLHDTLGPRQDEIIKLGDAYIALPGGIGTIYEVNNILALKRVGEISKEKPLILLGEYFNMLGPVFKTMINEGFADESITGLFKIVSNPEEAADLLASLE